MHKRLLQLKTALRQLPLWIWNGRYHLLSGATFVVTILYLIGIATFRPNIVALLMVLTGLSIILAQQVFDADKFGAHRPNTVVSWLKSVPTGRPVTLSLEGVSSATFSGKAHATVSVSPEATIERKVEFLLKQLECLDNWVAKIDDKVDDINASLGKTEKKLQLSIDTLHTSMSQLIAGHVVGSYDLNLFSVNITICGTIIQFFTS
jgi:hypothetical protein